MNVLAARRTAALWLLALAAIVVLLGSGQGTGQAAVTSTSSESQSIDTFTVQVLKSTWAYWNPQLTAAGHPGWRFSYLIVKGDKVANSPCGLIGDPDVYSSASPASYCRSDNAIYLSTRWLYDHMSNNATTPYGVANVIAHEVGHAVQEELRLPRHVQVKPVELQADCFSAMWVRHQVDIGSATPKEALDARHAAQDAGDYDFEGTRHHGTADERVKAWTRGFTGSYAACRALNPPAGR